SVRVKTDNGWLVLASDATHFYENLEAPSPFPIVYSVADMMDGFTKLKRLAQSDRHIIPGHDPLVFKHYPAVSTDLEGIAVRLDVPRID
ncbi:MAG: glyoxylase-like metal-dependent hydrolase (beta-lactamase superfamily II), partial [Gammaproteobacteria bacterium]